jgi:hypothetical protein
LNLKVYLSSKFAKAQSFSMFVLSILQTEVKEVPMEKLRQLLSGSDNQSNVRY